MGTCALTTTEPRAPAASAASSGLRASRGLRAHYGDLGRRPRIVEIAANVFRGHHVVGTAIRLAGDHRQLWHGRLRKGVQQLRAVPDDAVVLLGRSRQEAGYIDERDQRDVEGVA